MDFHFKRLNRFYVQYISILLVEIYTKNSPETKIVDFMCHFHRLSCQQMVCDVEIAPDASAYE